MEPKLTTEKVRTMINAESHLLMLGQNKQFRVRLNPVDGKAYVVIKRGELHDFSDVDEAVKFYNE